MANAFGFNVDEEGNICDGRIPTEKGNSKGESSTGGEIIHNLYDNIVVDGSMMEGGGQVLRISFGLAALLGLTLNVHSVRGKRSKPGLRPQHLCGLKLISRICKGSHLSGGHVNSSNVSFTPAVPVGPFKTEHVADAGGAGSTALMMQLIGGTDAAFAPPSDWIVHVLMPMLHKLDISINIDCVRRGFNPEGKGELAVASMQSGECITPFALDHRGAILSIKAVGVGFGITLWANTSTGCVIGYSALGEKRKSVEVVGEEAAVGLLRNIEHGGCVDEYLQDQLIILMALAKGKSTIITGPLTLHTETAISVANQVTGAKFSVTEASDEAEGGLLTAAGKGKMPKGKGKGKNGVLLAGKQHRIVIECDGIGLSMKNRPG